MKHAYSFICAAALASVISTASAQVFDKEQYQKALWMTARFYGAQRSGANHNWLLAEHDPTATTGVTASNIKAFVKGQDFVKDADGDYDLTGGWVDCGDNVKFGQTEFYSGYMLALGYSEFPTGYDDFYSDDYRGYIGASDYTWEGKKGVPNGIPDILDELKYATDFFIKCVRDKNTFYYQVGDGDADHAVWCTSSVKATLPTSQGGESNGSRPVKKATGNTTSMTALCGATLASMSRSYRPFDAAYADKCLEKAKVAYEYVLGTPKGNTGAGFYPEKGKYEPDIVILAMELYRTTNDATYLQTARQYATWMQTQAGYNHYYSLCYNNTEDLACYLMSMYDNDSYAKVALQFYCDMYKPSSGKVLNVKNATWGTLRFPANQAFVYALNEKVKGNTTKLNEYSLGSIEYIMGSNGKKFSYIVGFGQNFPHYPHHRNFYGLDNNDEDNLKPQEKYMQFGYMVGGSLKDGEYVDAEKEYTYSEGGIDYNAGLVASLGYINSIINPVSTNKFGHPSPMLGPDRSICGESSIVLDSKVPADGKKTFIWSKDGVVVSSNTSASTFEVKESGVYTCKIDSAGEWETSAKVTISGELPSVELESGELCDPAMMTLDATIDTRGATYQWSVDGEKIEGATSATYTVTRAGLYSCEIAVKGCGSISAESEITSRLPIVADAESSASGNVTLSVLSDGEYEWYDTPEGGTPLHVGSTFKTQITADKLFYVADAGAMSTTVGPKTNTFTSTSKANGDIAVSFRAEKPLSITGITLEVNQVYYNDGQPKAALAELTHNGVKTTFTSAEVAAPGEGKTEFDFSNDPIVITEAGEYSLLFKLDNRALAFYDAGPAYSTYAGAGDLITFTGAGSNGQNNQFAGYFDWKVTAGSGCARAIVKAVKGNASEETGYAPPLASSAINLYPNPASDMIHIEMLSEDQSLDLAIMRIEGKLVMSQSMSAETAASGIDVSSLTPGIYVVSVKSETTSQTFRLVIK